MIVKFLKQKFRNLKIVHKLSIIVTGVVVLSIIFAGMVSYVQINKVLMLNINAQREQTIQQTTKYINEKFEFVLQQFSALLYDPEFKRIAAETGDARYTADLLVMDAKFRKLREENSLMLEDIFFYRKDKKLFYEYTNMLNPNQVYEDTDWYRLAQEGNLHLVWIGAREQQIFQSFVNSRVFSIAQEVNDINFQPQGILVFDIKEDFLLKALEEINLSEDGCTFIVDNDRNIVSSTDAQYNGIYEQDIRNMLSSETRKGNFETARQEPMMVSYDTLDVNGWKIINMVPESFVTQQVSEVNSIILSVILISILIFVILTVSMIFLITRPIKQFTGVMKKVGDGDLSIRFRPAANDEIGLMAHTFDQMLDNINSLMEEVKTERDGKIFAELKTLQQQINSHFLYNTLDSIYWMSKSGNGDDAAEMIASLAQFIRLGLNNGEDMTTVAKEIEHVRNYMTIQKYRYDGKLNYRIDADKNAMDCVVPKLLLQPLVENSILHGIVKLSRPGHIDIRVQKRDNRVIFEVEDDGVGLDAEKIKARIASGKAADNGDTKGGYALYNIYNRLKMIYKDAARIEFYGRPGAGSKVTITLPA